jgi:hypothetical protein
MRLRIIVAGAVVFAVVMGASLPGRSGARAKKSAARPLGIVALIDSGINPYSVAFRDRSALARRHPSTYIRGYPKDAEALRLTLDAPYEEAVEKDAAVWAAVRRGILYWIPGTRIVGAISFGSGGTCSRDAPPPVNGGGDCSEHVILDDHGHGTMTSSRAAGSPRSLAPDARIVMIEGLGEQGVRWAADAGWIDVQSNSWLNLVPPPANSSTPEAFAHAAGKMVTIAASGNGTAYLMGAAPTPTYTLSTAPPGVILVGGHDNGKMTLWSGSPPHVVADAYSGFTAIRDTTKKMRPAPIACCTSAAAPYAAGGAIAIIQEARAILGDRTSGVSKGVIARGRKGVVKEGPLADGEFTLEEFSDLYFHTAESHPAEGRDDGVIHWAGEPRSPDHTEFGPGANPFCLGCTTTPLPWTSFPQAIEPYQFVGYGAINERSVQLALKVLHGREEAPPRPQADEQYALDQEIRSLYYP